jgi:hypothetical protein
MKVLFLAALLAVTLSTGSREAQAAGLARTVASAPVCRMSSTELNFSARDANFRDARKSLNARLDKWAAANPNAAIPLGRAFRIPPLAEYFRVSVDVFSCERPATKERRTSAFGSASTWGSTQSCDFVGCVEGWPGGSAPNGSVMTVVTCQTYVRTTVVYKKANGQWTVTVYKTEQVVECDELT